MCISGISKTNRNSSSHSGIPGAAIPGTHGTQGRSFAAALRNLAKNAGPNDESDNINESDNTLKKVGRRRLFTVKVVQNLATGHSFGRFVRRRNLLS